MTQKITLHYFDGAGRAEAVRGTVWPTLHYDIQSDSSMSIAVVQQFNFRLSLRRSAHAQKWGTRAETHTAHLYQVGLVATSVVFERFSF